MKPKACCPLLLFLLAIPGYLALLCLVPFLVYEWMVERIEDSIYRLSKYFSTLFLKLS